MDGLACDDTRTRDRGAYGSLTHPNIEAQTLTPAALTNSVAVVAIRPPQHSLLPYLSPLSPRYNKSRWMSYCRVISATAFDSDIFHVSYLRQNVVLEGRGLDHL